MEIQVIQIGNSKGIILSRAILERYDIRNKVDLELRKNHIKISAQRQSRDGWGKALNEMNSRREDILLIK
ncbi:MAG TPA: AbrB/MazE/SpoVT family DNA-binding domain-containing protein [Bacteroidales bacterium]|nr:AbrB/MazE/SpoVT family DNA-binding domain-containing protein [Bacteroidales bacterium]